MLFWKGLSAPGKSAIKGQEATGESRQTCGSVGVSELALKEPTLPPFCGPYARRLWKAHRADADVAFVIAIPERRRFQFRLTARPLILIQRTNRQLSTCHLENQWRYGILLTVQVASRSAMLAEEEGAALRRRPPYQKLRSANEDRCGQDFGRYVNSEPG